MKHLFDLSLTLWFGLSLGMAQTTSSQDANKLWAYEALHIPQLASESPTKAPIIVAIVDDGFRLSHTLIKDFIYRNPKELAGNRKDDDLNGYADDLTGWDVSDSDAEVGFPQGRENVFYHGTIMAGIVANVAQKAYGNNASKMIKILPVKVLGDQATNTYFSDGYKGIKYAIDQGADIICCAWSGGTASPAERSVILEAQRKGIIVVGSAGNLYSEKVYPPASIEGAVAVSGLDTTLHKLSTANYGMRIDLSAPGDKVWSASAFGDTYHTYGTGTSAAAALVTGCLTILKSKFPLLNTALVEALTNTATPLEAQNLSYAGKLGAGLPHLENALKYLDDPATQALAFNPQRTKGKIVLPKKNSKVNAWHIAPLGSYKGIRLTAEGWKQKEEGYPVLVKTGDSTYINGTLKDLETGILVPGNDAQIILPEHAKRPKNLTFNYFVETVDSSLLYCQNLVTLTQPTGLISDGSEMDRYANKSSCKWQITAPAGKRIRIEFTELDTEANMDFVWLFDGQNTIPEYLMAKFSGQKLPPSIVSRTNEVLVWFLSNETTTGKGWEFRYTIQE